MGSSYFGEPSLGNGRSGSSRKGKKYNSDKPKQPQRGLGVAQLEKIRLHNQINCNYLPPLHTQSYHSNLNQEQRLRMGAYPSLPSSSFAYSSTTSSSSPFAYQPNIMVGMGELDTRENGQGDTQSGTATSYNNGFLDAQYSTQSSGNEPLFRIHMEQSAKKKRVKDRCDSMGSSSQKSGSTETQELDLDLKLSL